MQLTKLAVGFLLDTKHLITYHYHTIDFILSLLTPSSLTNIHIVPIPFVGQLSQTLWQNWVLMMLIWSFYVVFFWLLPVVARTYCPKKSPNVEWVSKPHIVSKLCNKITFVISYSYSVLLQLDCRLPRCTLQYCFLAYGPMHSVLSADIWLIQYHICTARFH